MGIFKARFQSLIKIKQNLAHSFLEFHASHHRKFMETSKALRTFYLTARDLTL